MAYTTLRQGSTGDEVKKLQEALKFTGEDVDGIYGPKTAQAVKDYQTANGLQVDGIAGDETLGSLYRTSGTDNKSQVTGSSAPAGPVTTPDYTQYRYDPGTDAAYQQALAALQQAQQQRPSYAGTYDQQLQDIYQQIVGRKPFSYNVNEDALYRQYADQYTMQGKMAMMDTMGQAATLTGGYGSSYGQTVGQQAYQNYLQQLNAVVPELYGMALDQYNQEGQALLNQYAMVGDLADAEYGKYQDSLDRYWQELNYKKQQADDAYDQGYSNWYNAQQLGMAAQDTAYQRQEDAYDKLVSLITSTGYTPTAAELQAAGMSKEQAEAFAGYYSKQNGGSTGDGDYIPIPDGDDPMEVTGNLSTERIKQIQYSLGVNRTGVWDEDTIAASGYYDMDQAWDAYNKGNIGVSKNAMLLAGRKLNAALQNVADPAERENRIRQAYERGEIDAGMAEELLAINGLL